LGVARTRILLLLLVLLAACSAAADPDTDVAAPTTDATTTASTTSTSAAPTTTTEAATSLPFAASDPQPAIPEPVSTCVRLSEFDDQDANVWRALNDGVMGGRSSGGPAFDDGILTFAGEINTNGGGFSSVRAAPMPEVLAGADHMRLRGRSDGRTYQLIVRDALGGRDRRISFQAVIPFTTVGTWEEVTVAFEDLEASTFGTLVLIDPFVPEQAVELGIQISDGIDGPFSVDVDWMERCGIDRVSN
jgi:hypothetical protein